MTQLKLSVVVEWHALLCCAPGCLSQCAPIEPSCTAYVAAEQARLLSTHHVQPNPGPAVRSPPVVPAKHHPPPDCFDINGSGQENTTEILVLHTDPPSPHTHRNCCSPDPHTKHNTPRPTCTAPCSSRYSTVWHLQTPEYSTHAHVRLMVAGPASSPGVRRTVRSAPRSGIDAHMCACAGKGSSLLQPQAHHALTLGRLMSLSQHHRCRVALQNVSKSSQATLAITQQTRPVAAAAAVHTPGLLASLQPHINKHIPMKCDGAGMQWQATCTGAHTHRDRAATAAPADRVKGRACMHPVYSRAPTAS